MNDFTKRRLDAAVNTAHRGSMEYIDIVSDAAGDYMKANNIEYHIGMEIDELVRYASLQLSIPFDEVYPYYRKFMILQEMAEEA